MFKKVGSHHLLSHSIVEQIEQAIRDRKLVPGQKLPTENELCSTFGVSRTVMREALRVLHSRGLVSIQKGKGMFVNALTASAVTDPMNLYLSLNFDKTYVLDVIHARQAIEPSIAALAARYRTEDHIKSLHENMKRLEVLEGGSPGLAAIDVEFHMLVARASGNLLMPLIVEPIHRLMPKIKLSIYEVVSDAVLSALEYHARILSSIVAQDEEKARMAMTDHLQVAEHHTRLMLDAQKERLQAQPAFAPGVQS